MLKHHTIASGDAFREAPSPAGGGRAFARGYPARTIGVGQYAGS